MPHKINITDADITYAEGILLPEGEHFDPERVDFIKNLTTIDLQAVPGSGKTTALLAKLLILDRYLPFSDGSGILVISHTNAAVEEIQNKIGSYCKHIFTYPNFVGTIQVFVDQFLAVPVYENIFKSKIVSIDTNIHNQTAEKFSNLSIKGFSVQEGNNAKYYLRGSNTLNNIRLSILEGKIGLIDVTTGREIVVKKPKGNTKPGNYHDWREQEKKRVYEWLICFKKNILKKGILSFEDAYFLTSYYLMKYPKFKDILSSRFQYVFVDEMQDMDRLQYEILEEIFFADGNSSSVFQRIGDKNQAIYTEEVQIDDFWQERSVLELNGSHRLTPEIAAVVCPFAIRPIAIEAKCPSLNIKPHILVYTDETIKNVIPSFAGIVSSLIEQGAIPHTEKSKYKAIAWSTKPKEGDIRLPNYFEGFSKEEQSPKTDYSCLAGHLYLFNKKDKTLNSIRLNIMNAFIRILRLEDILDHQGRSFTKYSLNNFIREDVDWYDEFSLHLYNWCMQVIKGKPDDALVLIREYIPFFLTHFERKISNSQTFIDEKYIPVHDNQKKESGANFYEHPETKIKIEITTVHAVKGQTHTATLYMETHYQAKTDGGCYESERLSKQISQQNHPDLSKIKTYTKQSLKMIYVGFSRPTHLLCFAVHKDRFDANISDLNTGVWEVISC